MSSTQESESLRMSSSSGDANYKKRGAKKSAAKKGWLKQALKRFRLKWLKNLWNDGINNDDTRRPLSSYLNGLFYVYSREKEVIYGRVLLTHFSKCSFYFVLNSRCISGLVAAGSSSALSH